MTASIREGMSVRTHDGKVLGHVTHCFDEYFEVHHGTFYPKDYFVRYADVAAVEGHEARLVMDAPAVREVVAGLVMQGRDTAAERPASESLRHWLDDHRGQAGI